MGNNNSTQEILNSQEEDIYTEKTNVIFKSEDQLSNFEKNVILNFNIILTEKFTNVFNYFCFDYSFLQSVQTTEDLLREAFGDKFIEFIKFSNFFRLETQKNKSSENLNSAAATANNNYNNNNLNSNNIAATALQSNLNNKDVDLNLNANCCYDFDKLRLFVILTTKETFVTNNGFNYNDRVNLYFSFNYFFRLIMMLHLIYKITI
jgi:hypothetical protein